MSVRQYHYHVTDEYDSPDDDDYRLLGGLAPFVKVGFICENVNLTRRICKTASSTIRCSSVTISAGFFQ